MVHISFITWKTRLVAGTRLTRGWRVSAMLFRTPVVYR